MTSVLGNQTVYADYIFSYDDLNFYSGTGQYLITEDPTQDLGIATKHYVDQVAGGGGILNCANVGSGIGLFQNVTSSTANFKTLTSIDSTVSLTSATNTVDLSVDPSNIDHSLLENLTTGDPHTQYAYLNGRSGGQTLIGGTDSGDNLTLKGTSAAIKGAVVCNDTFVVGDTSSPIFKVNDVSQQASFSGDLSVGGDITDAGNGHFQNGLYCNVAVNSFQHYHAGSVATTAGGNASAMVYWGSAGAIQENFGSGAPTISMPKGSIYYRTDGTDYTNRIYVNTNGTTTYAGLLTTEYLSTITVPAESSTVCQRDASGNGEFVGVIANNIQINYPSNDTPTYQGFLSMDPDNGGVLNIGTRDWVGVEFVNDNVSCYSGLYVAGGSSFSVITGVPSILGGTLEVDDVGTFNSDIVCNGIMKASASTSPPTHGSTTAFLQLGDNSSFGIYWGSDVPTVEGSKGSLYLRTDGSSTSTRLYVAEDSVGTWTSVTTAALSGVKILNKSKPGQVLVAIDEETAEWRSLDESYVTL
jgi:hypothetical protein